MLFQPCKLFSFMLVPIFLDCMGCVQQVLCRLPSAMFCTVSNPFHKVLSFTVSFGVLDSVVNDIFNFIFQFTIYSDRNRWRVRGSALDVRLE